MRAMIAGALKTAVVLLVLSVVAMVITVALLRLFGSMEAWEQWRANHYAILLTWRLMLYVGLAFAWFKLKARLPEQARMTHSKRLRRVEILVALLVALIEVSRLAFQPGALA